MERNDFLDILNRRLEVYNFIQNEDIFTLGFGNGESELRVTFFEGAEIKDEEETFLPQLHIQVIINRHVRYAVDIVSDDVDWLIGNIIQIIS